MIRTSIEHTYLTEEMVRDSVIDAREFARRDVLDCARARARREYGLPDTWPVQATFIRETFENLSEDHPLHDYLDKDFTGWVRLEWEPLE